MRHCYSSYPRSSLCMFMIQCRLLRFGDLNIIRFFYMYKLSQIHQKIKIHIKERMEWQGNSYLVSSIVTMILTGPTWITYVKRTTYASGIDRNKNFLSKRILTWCREYCERHSHKQQILHGPVCGANRCRRHHVRIGNWWGGIGLNGTESREMRCPNNSLLFDSGWGIKRWTGFTVELNHKS